MTGRRQGLSRDGLGGARGAMSLSRNTAALGVGFLARTPVLLIYFVLATRSLGVEAYGVLAAVMAVCAITGPLASLGSTTLLVRHGARDPQSAGVWLGSGLTVSTLGSVVIGAAVLAVAPVLLPPQTPFPALTLLLAGELLLARVIDLSGVVFVALERMHLKTVNLVGYPLARLAAVAVLVAGPWQVTLTGWALAALLGTLAWSAVSLALAVGAVGRPRWSTAPYRSDWRQGLLSIAGLGMTNVHNDVDKVVLARLAGPEAAGVYAAAYRLVDAAYTPVRALLGAAFPRMFRHGDGASAELVPLLRRIGRPALGYSLLAVPALVLLAPVLPPVLGEGFAAVTPVLASLAVLVVLRTLRALPADALTGTGHQGRRTAAQLVVAVINVVALLVLVPRYGVWGAVTATLGAEALLAALLWALWLRLPPRPTAPSPRPKASSPRPTTPHARPQPDRGRGVHAIPATGDGGCTSGAPVVLVTGVLRPRRGMEVALLELARALATERDVHIVLVHGQDPGDAPVPVTALPSTGLVRRRRTLRQLLAEQPDAGVVVCGIWATAYLALAAPEVLPRAVGWEHSLTAARLRGAGPRTRLKMHLAGMAYRRTRAVVAVSEEVAATLRRWRVDAEVVPNLLPVAARAEAVVGARPGVGRTYGVSGRAESDHTRCPVVRVLTVGALVPVKNHPLVLQTLARLPDATLTVAGDGHERDRLQALARELGVDDRVEWLGHVDGVEPLMTAADVLLQPSASETFGYTLLEAGAAHLPVVALDVPVVRDLVPGLVPGLLVTGPDPAALAAAVHDALGRTRAGAWDFAGADERRATRFGREEVLTAWRQLLT